MRILRAFVIGVGLLAAALVIALVDRGSHSVSDTLYGAVLPVAGIAVLTAFAWWLVPGRTR